MTFAAWLRQPTTITGLASLAGLGLGVVADAVTHSSGTGAAVGGLVFAAVHLVVNDNSVAGDAEKLAMDVLDKAPAATVAGDVQAAIGDAAKLSAAK